MDDASTMEHLGAKLDQFAENIEKVFDTYNVDWSNVCPPSPSEEDLFKRSR